jgi:predicted AAA+ superfamily ATPase
MFYRKVVTALREWAVEPLILKGARQVGKTTAVDIFSKDFDHYISLNLEKEEDAEIFERNLPLEDLIRAIFFTRNLPLSKDKKILLFIDEIQNSPR